MFELRTRVFSCWIMVILLKAGVSVKASRIPNPRIFKARFQVRVPSAVVIPPRAQVAKMRRQTLHNFLFLGAKAKCLEHVNAFLAASFEGAEQYGLQQFCMAVQCLEIDEAHAIQPKCGIILTTKCSICEEFLAVAGGENPSSILRNCVLKMPAENSRRTRASQRGCGTLSEFLPEDIELCVELAAALNLNAFSGSTQALSSQSVFQHQASRQYRLQRAPAANFFASKQAGRKRAVVRDPECRTIPGSGRNSQSAEKTLQR